jgi:ATP-dependent RNA helicase DeaD
MNFNTLKIKQTIIDGIVNAKYDEMTSIQEQIIPIALEGKDIIVQAPTGTGKTCAFVVPTLEQLNPSEKAIQILVLCPTRELAMQITTEYKKIGNFIGGVKTLAIYGGQKIGQQLKYLRDNPQIIVSTPGRLLDHLQQRTINLSQVKTVVLDEADEMLDMGFIRDIDKILAKTNAVHQTILLSATMPKPIMEISRRYQKSPVFVKATLDEKDIPSIDQHYIKTPEHKKLEVILKLIKDKNFFLVLIFTNTRHKAKSLVRQLRDNKIMADAIHSDLKQTARDRVMRLFREGKIQVLVATDIAARGIDVKGVDAVINYDVPKNMEYYVHRIGRTARAKMTGSAYTLISNDLRGNVRSIENKTNDKLNEHVMEGIDFNEAPPARQPRQFDRERSSSDRPRFDRPRGDRPERSERSDRPYSDRPARSFDRPQPENNGTSTRFFATVGSKDQMDNESLKSYLIDKVGVAPADIIDV